MERGEEQCVQLAAEAETARASMLTCKGSLRGAKSLEELLRENAYLSDMLKQKESQMEVAEQQWKKQLVEAVRKATEDEEVSTGSAAGCERNVGYSYPLPSNHPFVDTRKMQSTPQRGSAPIGVAGVGSSLGVAGVGSSLGVGRVAAPVGAARVDSPINANPVNSPISANPVNSPIRTSRTSSPAIDAPRIVSPVSSSDGTLLTQSLNTTRVTDSSLLSFDSLLNDVMRQANQLREVADYYERQE